MEPGYIICEWTNDVLQFDMDYNLIFLILKSKLKPYKKCDVFYKENGFYNGQVIYITCMGFLYSIHF